ncbi:hypothetical protein ACI2OX_15485 [Bacillus sp. N9]
MKKGVEEKRTEHPMIRKCLQHLEIINASDKEKQIVYMYMKAMDEEIVALKEKSGN